MDERYVAFDVETPNAQNRRMSAIGVCVIEQGQIVQELDTLVEKTFEGSLPAFVAAFARKTKLSQSEVDQLRAMIDGFEEAQK